MIRLPEEYQETEITPIRLAIRFLIYFFVICFFLYPAHFLASFFFFLCVFGGYYFGRTIRYTCEYLWNYVKTKRKLSSLKKELRDLQDRQRDLQNKQGQQKDTFNIHIV